LAKPIIPSDSHRFIKLVESNSKLLRNYSWVNFLFKFLRKWLVPIINMKVSFSFFMLSFENLDLTSQHIDRGKKAQNIDTLEMRAGVKNLIQCHGQ
jgi:NAD-dependent SIR2 family protein deacetylase